MFFFIVYNRKMYLLCSYFPSNIGVSVNKKIIPDMKIIPDVNNLKAI